MKRYYAVDEEQAIELVAQNYSAAKAIAIQYGLKGDIQIEPVKGHHLCPYCGNIDDHEDEDLLCADCREMFGHAFYSEL